MILPGFVLPSRQNQIWTESGMDSLELCLDKKHFKSYPYPIEYRYNSRGYRDAEWPNKVDELKNSIWCIGDSFTVGLGCPITHTWPYILQQQTKQRTINVSMDGASNLWIARKALELLEEVDPILIVLHWSYVTRGEDTDTSNSDEQRRKYIDYNILEPGHETDNFIRILQQFENCNTIIHSFIPEFSHISRITACKIWEQLQGPSWPGLPTTIDDFNSLDSSIVLELKQFGSYDDFTDHFKLLTEFNKLQLVPEVKRLDLARDSHHYDKLTAENFVDQLLSLTTFPRQQ